MHEWNKQDRWTWSQWLFILVVCAHKKLQNFKQKYYLCKFASQKALNFKDIPQESGKPEDRATHQYCPCKLTCPPDRLRLLAPWWTIKNHLRFYRSRRPLLKRLWCSWFTSRRQRWGWSRICGAPPCSRSRSPHFLNPQLCSQSEFHVRKRHTTVFTLSKGFSKNFIKSSMPQKRNQKLVKYMAKCILTVSLTRPCSVDELVGTGT